MKYSSCNLRPRSRSAGLLLLLVILASSAGGCSWGSRGGSPTKEGLEKRCNEYWGLRIDGNWKSIYDFLAPDEQKFYSRKRFMDDRSQQLRFTEYKIDSVEVNGTRGISKVKSKWQITIPGDTQSHRDGENILTEYWLFVNGNWYLQLLNPPVEATK